MTTLKSMDVARLRSLLAYDPDSGVFTWRVGRGPLKAGAVAGYRDRLGYRYIVLDYRMWPATRLAWALMTGAFPGTLVDHINRDATDDRWANLRLASRAQNMMNTTIRRDNSTGYKGVSRRPSGRFRAHIQSRGRSISLGDYNTAEEAHAAYMRAAEEMFGVYATAGDKRG